MSVFPFKEIYPTHIISNIITAEEFLRETNQEYAEAGLLRQCQQNVTHSYLIAFTKEEQYKLANTAAIRKVWASTDTQNKNIDLNLMAKVSVFFISYCVYDICSG